jgi:glycosyltransferase involved in cell wall biosynthesis
VSSSFHKKNIIILGPAHPLRPGGITTFNERLCRAFLAANHSCSIWSFSLQYPSFLFPGSSQFTDAPAPEGIAIHSEINSVNPINWIRVGNKLRKIKPDIIVVRYWIPLMGPCLGTILRIVKKNRHTQVVCIADNVIPHESRPGDRAFTKYFVQPVDSFVVMSKQVLQDLKTFTNKSAQLLPHPLYDNFGVKEEMLVARKTLRDQFNLPVEDSDQLLVFFGLVRHYKGLDILIDALKVTKSSKPKLLVAGEFYDKESDYREQIARLGLANQIIIHNQFIAEADVKHFICAGDCIIQPYRDATQSGVTPVAYHFEIPMIVTNVGGLPEMVPNEIAGLVAEPTAASLAESVEAFFAKGKQYFMPGLLEEKKKLSWENLTSAIVQASAKNG